MHRKPQGLRALLLVVFSFACLSMPVGAYALGLGKLKVHSALNEPLNAEIDFTSIAEKELKGLKVSLGSRQDFQSAGATRLPFYGNIKFTVSKRANGQYFLLLQTQEPVLEPFMHIVIRLEWPGAQVVREYSALIDPPQYLVSKPTGVETPVTAPVAPAAAVPVAEPAKPVLEAPKPEAKAADAPKPAEAKPVPEPLAKIEPLPEPKAQAEPAGQPEPAASLAADDGLLGPGESTVRMDASGWPDHDTGVAVVEPLPAPVGEAPGPATATAVSGTGVYKIKRGDTLWEIAERIRKDWKASNRTDAQSPVTTEQLVMAIFNNNQNAFFRNNVNNMYAGKVLNIPEPEATQGLNRQAARKEFRAQYDVWQEYKLKLASAGRAIQVSETEPVAAAPVEAKPPAPEKEAQSKKPEQAPTKAEAKPEAPPAPVAPTAGRGKQPEELLKIVRATLENEKAAPKGKVAEAEAAKDAGSKERLALAERVTTLEESLESKKAETKEMQQKAGEVKETLQKQSRLMEIENQQLAKATAKPGQAATEVEKPKPEATAPATTPKPAEPPKAAVTPVAPQKAPKKPARAAPPPPEEKGMLASFMDYLSADSMMPVIGGIVAIAGGAILLVYLRRRQRSIAEFEESILAADALSTEAPLTGDTGGQPAVAAGDTSFLSDFSQGGMGNIHTDEVDPVAEAEVYLAYGRDETAEEILKDAIVKHPDRPELKLKLLEIYHQRNDSGAFETLAEELYASVGGRGGKVWDKVAEMGRKLNPNNPMFRGAGAAAPATAVGTTTALMEPRTAEPTGKAASAVTDSSLHMDFSAPAGAEKPEDDEGVSFDFETKAPAETASTDDSGIDFEIPSAVPAAEKKGNGGLDAIDFGESSDNAIDFDLGTSEVAVEPEAPATPDSGEINWDFESPTAAPAEPVSEIVESESAAGEGGEEGQAQWDETATKLDLAKAYIDMGDSEGARSILDEVLAEGNDTQKKEAADLAAQIA